MQCAKIRTLAEPFASTDPRTDLPTVIPPWTVAAVPIEDAVSGQAQGKLQMLAGLSPEAIIEKPEDEQSTAPPTPPPTEPKRRTYKRRDILPESGAGRTAAALSPFMQNYLDPAFEPEPETQIQVSIPFGDGQDQA